MTGLRFFYGRGARAALAALLLAAIAPAAAQTAPPARPAELAVEARNLTTPELCAEKDNVQIDFASPLVRSFRIQAAHPAYIGTIGTDRWAADLTSCDFRSDSATFADGGERVTLWETPEMWLVGYRLKEFWRPATTGLRVGDKVTDGLHIVQLWMNYRERAEEFLVFYPADGYWRARPLPFGDMRWTAYGSSFLIGPVEVKERPIVDLKEIAFDPASKTFTLSFRAGGTAKLKVAAIDQEHIALDVAFDGPMPNGAPFASLRSMYTTEYNADAARMAWREQGAPGWKEANIFGFRKQALTELWVGRQIPSRHNMSAPDMIFSRFAP